jgi:hypothetical protein
MTISSSRIGTEGKGLSRKWRPDRYLAHARRLFFLYVLTFYRLWQFEKRKKHMNSKESQKSLSEVGFTSIQVERLTKFRKEYVEKAKHQVSAEQRRLEFVRWLVATGRLTEY